MTDPAKLADQAAEAIRALNHATLNTDSLPYPSSIYDTVGALERMAYGLPQAFGQLRHRLDQFHTTRHVTSDAGHSDLPERLRQSHAWLANASAAASSLGHALEEAHAHLSHLAYKD